MASTWAAVRELAVRAGYGRVGLRGGLNTTGSASSIQTFTRAMPRSTGYNTAGVASRLDRAGTQTQRSNAIPRSCTAPRRTIIQQLRGRLFHSSRVRNSPTRQNPNPTPHLNSPPKNESLSLSQRLRKLSREYGWSALGVYLLLSALDFPFCYLLVRYLGTDRIGEWEHIIVSNVKMIIPESVKSTWHEWRDSVKQAEHEAFGDEEISDHVEMVGWGVEEADAKNKRDASLATQLALAYAIHKSFIFIRVPITAAVTPKVVKILRSWGWDIGKRTTKAAKAAKRADNS